MSVRILCAGDLHLGRRPSRVPEGLDARALGPAAAWQAFVGVAIDRRVSAVVLTGDVVDQNNRFYEAFSILQAGVERLVEADIPIFAVAGNHDFQILPRLADQFEAFHLLGHGGRWEERVLEPNGGQPLRFQGWCFPASHVRENPLKDYTPPQDELPTLGLLHCDCDAPGSSYAPVSQAELKGKAPSAWLLGHIHRPALLSESLPLILYPGSPQGLDPSESGAHGAWLVTVNADSSIEAELLPLASLRWEHIALSLDEVRDEEAFEQAVVDALLTKHSDIQSGLDLTKAVGCRLLLEGRTPIHRQLPRLTVTIREELMPVLDNVTYFVDEVKDQSRPDIDLAALARSTDPVGLLARRLILLDRREPAGRYQEMVGEAKRRIEADRSRAVFATLPDGADRLADEDVGEMLLRAGWAILDELLAQRERQS